MKFLLKFNENIGFRVNYLKSLQDPYNNEIEKLATEFFGSDVDIDQIPADDAAFLHELEIGSSTPYVITETGELVGWAFAFHQ